MDIIYHTYGACAFYDCTQAVVATLGQLTLNAKKAADKLNVQIWDYDFIQNHIKSIELNQISTLGSDRDYFDAIWKTILKTWKGWKLDI